MYIYTDDSKVYTVYSKVIFNGLIKFDEIAFKKKLGTNTIFQMELTVIMKAFN